MAFSLATRTSVASPIDLPMGPTTARFTTMRRPRWSTHTDQQSQPIFRPCHHCPQAPCLIPFLHHTQFRGFHCPQLTPWIRPHRNQGSLFYPIRGTAYNKMVLFQSMPLCHLKIAKCWIVFALYYNSKPNLPQQPLIVLLTHGHDIPLEH